MKTTGVVAGIFSLFVVAGAEAAPILPGTVETFDAPHDWVIGAGPVAQSPTLVPTALGGPGGALDPYLSLVSTGAVAGPGSRLGAQNFGLWAGDYLAGGVNRIKLDARNFGTTDVYLRLLFVDFAGMAPVNAAFTHAVFLPGGSGWESIAFDISAGALTPVLGSAAAALANTDELRIFHNPDPFFIPSQNPAIAANVGVDNITASAPEPATWLLFGTAAAFGARRRRRQSRSDVD